MEGERKENDTSYRRTKQNRKLVVKKLGVGGFVVVIRVRIAVRPKTRRRERYSLQSVTNLPQIIILCNRVGGT